MKKFTRLRFKTLCAAAALSVMALSSITAIAGEHPITVIELFTSQGCSSCPPANEFVGKLSENENVLALTYGVTYWDYLGWKDTFGKAEFTQRQHEYGQAFGGGNVYTPQIVLNGSAHSPRYTGSDVATMPMEEIKNCVGLSAEDGKLVLNAHDDVVLVTYKPGWQDVPVKAGENSGRTLLLANIVTDIESVKAGEQPKSVIETGYAYAALQHDPVTRKIVSASVYAPKSQNK